MKTKFLVMLYALLILTYLEMNAQTTTYSFNYYNGYVKRSQAMVEDDAGNILALIYEYTGTDYTPHKYYRAGILKFSPTGDTSTQFYSFGDTAISLTAMSKAQDGGYLLSGQAGTPLIGNSRLLLIKTDAQCQKAWSKDFYIEGVLYILPEKIITDENGWFVFGAVNYSVGGGWYPFMARFDKEGQMLRYYIYPDHGLVPFEFVLNPAANRIWLFSGPTLDPFNRASRLVFDTTFNYLSGEELPGNILHGFDYFLWLNDTSFYVSTLGFRNEMPSSHDHEFSLSLYDTTMNRLSYGEFGNLDTDDYPGFGMPFDFINPDTIFYTGTIELQFYPIVYGHQNWIMVGQTDRNLNERYRRYIGGDANYWSWNILALNDGGCFVNTAKLNEDLLIFDLVFFRLDQNGQLVYTTDAAMMQQQFISYPNPVKDYLNVEGPSIGYEVQLFSQDGRLIQSVHSQSDKTQIRTSGLKSGMYFISYLLDGKHIETEKIIKF